MKETVTFVARLKKSLASFAECPLIRSLMKQYHGEKKSHFPLQINLTDLPNGRYEKQMAKTTNTSAPSPKPKARYW